MKFHFLKSFTAFLLGCAILFSCNSHTTENKNPTPMVAEENLSKQVYEDNCAVCHGNDGTSQISGAANLQTSNLSIDSIQQQITNGKNNMPPFKEIISQTQIKQLSEYVKSLHKY